MVVGMEHTHASGGSGAASPVRVIAVDDHPLTRRGVAQELGEDARLEVLGTFPSFGAVPLPLRTPSQVQVAVIDLAVRHETRGVERRNPDHEHARSLRCGDAGGGVLESDGRRGRHPEPDAGLQVQVAERFGTQYFVRRDHRVERPGKTRPAQ